MEPLPVCTFMPGYLRQARQTPVTSGNILHPIPVGRTPEGDWRNPAELAGVAAIAGATLLGGLLLLSRRG